MTALPFAVAGLSEVAIAAYTAWSDALIERADHTLDCRECSFETLPACGTGAALYEHEQRVWAEWNAIRNAERSREVSNA